MVLPRVLQDKPRFADVAQEFVDFIQGAELIIHNAPFDVGFLNMELRLLAMQPLPTWCDGVIDTLAMAKALRPGQRNNLDALCKRYGVDNAARTLHGALVDCELLAAVYLALTRGQESLSIGLEARSVEADRAAARARPKPVLLQASTEELASHASLLETITRESKGACLWSAVLPCWRRMPFRVFMPFRVQMGDGLTVCLFTQVDCAALSDQAGACGRLFVPACLRRRLRRGWRWF